VNGPHDISPALHRYLVGTIAVGVGASAVALAAGDVALDATLATRVALLVGLGALAERFTLHLTHKTAVNTTTAVYIAMVLTLPLGLVPLMALLAAMLGQVSRRRPDAMEIAFNAAQTALSVGAAAVAYAALAGMPGAGPDVTGFGGVGALVLTAVAFQGAGSLLVAGAAGLQLGTSIRRTWAGTLTEGLAVELALSGLGVAAAALLRDSAVLLPVLALPILVLHRALQELVRLRTDTHAALAELVEVVELRDPYTAGHSRRVAELGHRLAIQMGLTYEEADVIESAGRVHDLGKVAIDPAVLMKPGGLTDEEFAEMRRHPELSGQVVAKFAAYGDGWLPVRHHHERWDGKGYPDGLAGESIPLGARILAVADTFDALTSARPYRQARTTAFALEVLREGAGTQWDPAAVEALLALMGSAAVADGPVPALVESATSEAARPVASGAAKAA
jgi:HD-GYP domain-containing protein (c-di-GMP phosphodiesterase class II)